MSTFVWTVTIASTVVTAMSLLLLATDDDPAKRRLRVGTVIIQGGLALWGYAVLGVFS